MIISNELIATKLHEKLGWTNFSPHTLGRVVVDDKEVPCSYNPLFTSTELEFVSAYQLVRDVNENVRIM